MHIGIDIRSLTAPVRTGVGEYAHEFLEALFKIDTDNQYSLFANGRPEVLKHLPSWQHPNVRTVLSHYPNKLFNASSKLFSYPALDTLITSKTKPPQTLDYFFSPNLNFTSLSPSAKHILTVHDLSFEFFPEFFSRKQRIWHSVINPRKTCVKAYRIITPSENTKRDLINHYSLAEEKIRVIPHGISTGFLEAVPAEAVAKLQAEYHLPAKYILFLGTLEPRKNILGLVQGFEAAAAYLPNDLHLVIAGSPGWNTTAFFHYLKTSPLRARIHHVGYIRPADKPSLYRHAELFVYPSFYEGFGFPVLEAMASGTPVITSSRSSLPEVAGPAAYYINPNKPQTIAEGIYSILTNSTLKNRLMKDGLSEAKKFLWESSARAFLSMLND